jgi:hypothetical protein
MPLKTTDEARGRALDGGAPRASSHEIPISCAGVARCKTNAAHKGRFACSPLKRKGILRCCLSLIFVLRIKHILFSCVYLQLIWLLSDVLSGLPGNVGPFGISWKDERQLKNKDRRVAWLPRNAPLYFYLVFAFLRQKCKLCLCLAPVGRFY